ncbi:MAG TPA: hypothetical protein VFV41_23115 [Streptosporangiaceae bacterium]|nr:hypothetical protein [Streptosporangiaceae bacterium]
MTAAAEDPAAPRRAAADGAADGMAAAPAAEPAARPVDPLAGSVVTKYLIRVWPAGTEAAELQQSEMCSPASVTEGQDGNDRAEIRAVRNWAQSRANVEKVSYCFEVCRDSMVAALAGSGSARRDVTPIASGTLEPGGELAGD